MRKAQVEQQNGNVEEAFKTAAGVIEAEYEWPFQSHASMGPACALVGIEGNIVQGVSRTLWEEVTFDNKTVTSVDWLSYPILDVTETSGQVVVVLINHPDLPPTGAGEPSIRPVAAAIANAVFDATGVRIRRVPFSPDRVKQALS